MRYFITVTLSKHEVTMKYYRDDDGLNQLIPFQGANWPIPLAIHIADSDIIVGQEALSRFEVQQPNTFYKLFSLIDSGETYSRFGLQKTTDHLIYLALESTLSHLMTDELGLSLESERHHLPLGFNFSADISADERERVIALFEKGDGTECGGYDNVGVIDADMQIARIAFESNHRRHALVLRTDRQNLIVTLYDRDNISHPVASQIMKDLGIDRRIMNGVNEIKAYVCDVNPNINFSAVEQRLEKIVEDFIATNKMEMNSKVQINGENYRFSLTRDDLRSNAAVAERQYTAQHLRHFLHNYSIDPDNTIIILASSKLQNSYFLPMFKENFESVYSITEQQTEQAQQNIINDIIASGYTFSQASQAIASLEKEWAKLRGYITDILLPEHKFDHALDDINDFVDKINNASQLRHNDKESLLNKTNDLRQTIAANQSSYLKDLERKKAEQQRLEQQRLEQQRLEQQRLEQQRLEQQRLEQQQRDRCDVVVTPPDYIEQLIDSITEEIDQFTSYGDYTSARNSYKELENEITNAGQKEKYASTLLKLKQKSAGATGGKTEVSPVSMPNPPVTKSADPLTQAIADRDFRLARKICKQNEDFDRYQTMKELDDAHKKFVVHQKYINEYLAEGNTRAIERGIRELSEYIALLNAVGQPHPEVDQLLNRYKAAQ